MLLLDTNLVVDLAACDLQAFLLEPEVYISDELHDHLDKGRGWFGRRYGEEVNRVAEAETCWDRLVHIQNQLTSGNSSNPFQLMIAYGELTSRLFDPGENQLLAIALVEQEARMLTADMRAIEQMESTKLHSVGFANRASCACELAHRLLQWKPWAQLEQGMADGAWRRPILARYFLSGSPTQAGLSQYLAPVAHTTLGKCPNVYFTSW